MSTEMLVPIPDASDTSWKVCVFWWPVRKFLFVNLKNMYHENYSRPEKFSVNTELNGNTVS
jgi:hypothetical protein